MREKRELLTTRQNEVGMCHTKGIMQCCSKTKSYRENLCEIQWNKNENTEIVDLHADDLQSRFHSEESERENVLCIQLGPLILFNVEQHACVRLAVLRGNKLSLQLL